MRQDSASNRRPATRALEIADRLESKFRAGAREGLEAPCGSGSSLQMRLDVECVRRPTASRPGAALHAAILLLQFYYACCDKRLIAKTEIQNHPAGRGLRLFHQISFIHTLARDLF